jgi:uncharacterized protein (UPF0264 family)
MESARAIHLDANPSMNIQKSANQVKVKMLASVSNLDEAAMALSTGVDIIDLKDPNQGALGALAMDEIAKIVKLVNGRSPVSATIGDLSIIEDVTKTIQSTIKTGVDIIKIGFFDKMDYQALVQAVSLYSKEQKIIAVLFADGLHDFSVLPLLRNAGFYGVMLDTANKNGQHLLSHLNLHALKIFILQAKQLKLEVGLAGALRESQVAELSALQPNYLGFRSALCEESQRENNLNAYKISHIKNMLQKYNNQANKRLGNDLFCK